MTGYGKADTTYNGKKIHVEVKSLNGKSLDVSMRLAPLYREKEMDLRRKIAAALVRGKVDFTLWVEKEQALAGSPINVEAVKAYVEQIREVSASLGIAAPKDGFWDVLVRLPETTQPAVAEELSDEEWAATEQAVDEALARLESFRRQEGEALRAKFCEKVDNIERLMGQIEPYEKARTEKIRQRLEERLAELTGVDYDKNRLEQELIYYIEKLDISEEKQRLTNHLKYFRETMDGPCGQGKKLGFIAQEMGREINTTGSKSNLAEMQNIVVKMKDELEQIKEQVLNVM